MRLKLLSVFLLSLFSIVIAFPGYSNGTASVKVKASTIQKAKSTEFTWKLLLKKCLKKGVNLIEEERSVEENGDNGVSKEVCYELVSHSYKAFIQSKILYRYVMEEYPSMSMRSVPYPPPNCI